MATEILNSFGALEKELEQAKTNLKGVDEHLKKLIGRDPGEGLVRPGNKRPSNNNNTEEFKGRGRGFITRDRRDADDSGPPSIKRRINQEPRTVFSRLSGPLRNKRDGDSGDEDDLPNKPAISSRVIATCKEPPSRQEALAAQSKDEKSNARNRRMFGALLGTLQRFRQEETKMKYKEDKRAQVEKKLEENAKREKEELIKERQELFQERKRKQAEIKKIELKLVRIKEHDEWELKQKYLLNFIQTKTKPNVFFSPKLHNEKSQEKLATSQEIINKIIDKKRDDLKTELEAIEKRGRWRQGITSESQSDVMNVDDVPQDKENLPDSQPEDNDVLAAAILDADDINDISLEEEKPIENKNEDGSNCDEEAVLRPIDIKQESTSMEHEEIVELVNDESPSNVIKVKTEKSENLLTKQEKQEVVLEKQQSSEQEEDSSEQQKESNEQEVEMETDKEIVENDKSPSKSLPIQEQIENERTDEEPISTASKPE